MVTNLDRKMIEKLFDMSNVIKFWEKEETNEYKGTIDIFKSTPLHMIEYNDRYIHVVFEEIIYSYIVTDNFPSNIKIYDGIEIKSPNKKSKIYDYFSDKEPFEMEKRVSYVLFDRNTKDFAYPDEGGYTSEIWETETYKIQ